MLLAPYWNNFCEKQVSKEDIIMNIQIDLKGDYGCSAGYFMGISYVMIVVTLYRVQYELEDPFDGVGHDDIKWERWRAQTDQLGNYGEGGPKRRALKSKAAAKAKALD